MKYVLLFLGMCFLLSGRGAYANSLIDNSVQGIVSGSITQKVRGFGIGSNEVFVGALVVQGERHGVYGANIKGVVKGNIKVTGRTSLRIASVVLD